MRDALLRVNDYVSSQGKTHLEETDLAVWGDITKLMKED